MRCNICGESITNECSNGHSALDSGFFANGHIKRVIWWNDGWHAGVTVRGTRNVWVVVVLNEQATTVHGKHLKLCSWCPMTDAQDMVTRYLNNELQSRIYDLEALATEDTTTWPSEVDALWTTIKDQRKTAEAQQAEIAELWVTIKEVAQLQNDSTAAIASLRRQTSALFATLDNTAKAVGRGRVRTGGGADGG